MGTTTRLVETEAAEIAGIPHFVGGQKRLAPESATLPVYDPSTGEQTGSVPLASDAEVDEAVAMARLAQPAWVATTLAKRTEVFFRFLDLQIENSDRLALAVTREHGKVLSDARGEISRGLENGEFACGLSHLLKGSKSSEVSTGIDVEEYRFPVGVALEGLTVWRQPHVWPRRVPLFHPDQGRDRKTAGDR